MRQYFDTQLNKVSMYHLMTIILTGLGIISLILSSLGLIDPTPLELSISAAVFIFSVGLVSWLVGYAFGVQAHGESSIITALILFFIFSPSLQPKTLVIYVFIGIIAGASKFLLTWNRRHIFNPAAIAAIIIGITMLAYASWWVATPWLFIPTFIGALVIMYKTNHLLMGLTFLLTSSAIFVISQLLYGDTILAGLVLLMSWPIVFFAGYMLTEPLTLPKNKWQSLVLAILLAATVALPVKIGEFLIAPATALVIANLISAFLNHRSSITLKYVDSRPLTPTSKELHFTSSRPISFEAGQYIELTRPHNKADKRGVRRYFSITSAPGTNDLTVAMKFYTPSSTFKQAIQDLGSSTIITATGVYGSFTLPQETNKKLVFFAGGIGITPFISFLRTIAAKQEKRDIILVYSVSTPAEIAYKDELRKSGIQVYVVSKEPMTSSDNFNHIALEHMNINQLADAVTDLASRTAYISGPPLFVRDIKKQLKQHGVSHIKTDYFTGY